MELSERRGAHNGDGTEAGLEIRKDRRRNDNPLAGRLQRPTGKAALSDVRTKKEADAARVRIEGEIAQGVHTPRMRITVAEAAGVMDKTSEGEGLERSTLREYRNHVDSYRSLIGAKSFAAFDPRNRGVPRPAGKEEFAGDRTEGAGEP